MFVMFAALAEAVTF